MRNTDAIPLSRRAVLPLLGLGGGALLVGETVAQRGGGGSGVENPDWPHWAPTRAALYAQFSQWRARGKDIRAFGAKLDGQADDSAALEKAVAAGVAVLLIPAGTLRLTKPIVLSAPIAILGAGDGSVIRWEGRQRDAFVAMPANKDQTAFVTGVHIDSIRLVRPAPSPSNGTILRGLNVRKVSVTRCSTDRFGGLFVGHLRVPVRDGRKDVHDPALDAGFSATGDDLNEDVLAYDNRIDGGAFMSQILRVNFGRRIAAVGNTGRFANISWSGGGGRINEGGALQYLRRARDIYVTHNTVHGANGGVYGNNGDGILVARNTVSDMLDVGIDFEGCFNALAHDNIVKTPAITVWRPSMPPRTSYSATIRCIRTVAPRNCIAASANAMARWKGARCSRCAAPATRARPARSTWRSSAIASCGAARAAPAYAGRASSRGWWWTATRSRTSNAT